MANKTKLEKDIDKIKSLTDNDSTLEPFHNTVNRMERAMRDYIIDYDHSGLTREHQEKHYNNFKSILGIK